jgi:hypothetical protein
MKNIGFISVVGFCVVNLAACASEGTLARGEQSESVAEAPAASGEEAPSEANDGTEAQSMRSPAQTEDRFREVDIQSSVGITEADTSISDSEERLDPNKIRLPGAENYLTKTTPSAEYIVGCRSKNNKPATCPTPSVIKTAVLDTQKPRASLNCTPRRGQGWTVSADKKSIIVPPFCDGQFKVTAPGVSNVTESAIVVSNRLRRTEYIVPGTGLLQDVPKITKQMSPVKCLFNVNWGYNDKAVPNKIWADKFCAATFDVSYWAYTTE